MSNEQEFIPQIAKGYTCKLCGIDVPEGEFHDCELDEPLKWGQIGSDNQKTTTSDWLERISSLSKLCDEKSKRIKELEAQLQEAQNKIMWLEKDLADTKTRCEQLTAQLQTAKSEAIAWAELNMPKDFASTINWRGYEKDKADYIGQSVNTLTEPNTPISGGLKEHELEEGAEKAWDALSDEEKEKFFKDSLTTDTPTEDKK